MFKLIITFSFIFTFCDFTVCLSDNALPEVNTLLGKIRGFWGTSFEGRKYAAFEGIPYARPPVDNLRFEDAVPITRWKGLWEANNPDICVQIGASHDDILGDEDCLYLNVYFPAEFLDNSKELDVVVQIHGGGFNVGSAHGWINSSFFMDEDIVLVSMNYRLGLFGFLSTEDDIIPGNNGMKDQVLALKWVKDNIASFGGNPNSITIDGHSAGAAAVHLHYLSPLSKELFHRGVSRSGTALSPWAIQENMSERTKQLSALVGCATSPSKALKRCLKRIPVQGLMRQVKYLNGYDVFPMTIFAPVIERGGKRPFLDKHPYLLLKEGKVFDVPWVTSVTTDDGLLASAVLFDKLDEVNEMWSEVFQYILECNYTLPESERKTVSRQILDYYLGPGENISRENFEPFTQVCTDRWFGSSGELSAKLQANVTKSSVYFYFFNYHEGVNKVIPSEEIEGVAHGEDMLYFTGYGTTKPFSEQDRRLKNAFHEMLYSFSSTGKPSFDGTDIWTPTDSSALTYLNITGPENMKLQTIDELTPLDFWSKLGLLAD